MMRSGVPKGTLLLMALSALNIALGYGREAVFAYYFGASAALDSFLVALTLPRLLALLTLKATVAVVLPIYIAYRERGQADRASELVRRWFWRLAAFVAAVCVVLALFAEGVVELLAPGLAEGPASDAARWLRWLLPYAWIMGVAATFKVVLDTHRRFAGPASANSLINLAVIAACGLAASRWGVSCAVPGFIVGAVLAFLFQWSRSRGPEPGVPALRQRYAGAVDMPYAAAGVMSINLLATQAHIVVDRGFASALPPGSIAALNYAATINMIPVTVASTALATALFPVLATLTARGEWARAVRTLRNWSFVVGGLGLAAALALIALRVPIVSLLLERGRFGEDDVASVSSVLAILPMTIVTVSLATLVDRLLLAQQRVAALAGLAVGSIALKVGLNVVFVGGLDMGLFGLALATVCASCVVVVIRFFLVMTRSGYKGTPPDRDGNSGGEGRR